jgi:hypothetical protein
MALAAGAWLAGPTLASAQSNQGTIAVSAIIAPLPAAPGPTTVTMSVRDGATALLSIESAPSDPAHTLTPFLRLTRVDAADADAVYAAPRSGSATRLIVQRSSYDTRFRLERLITAGT